MAAWNKTSVLLLLLTVMTQCKSRPVIEYSYFDGSGNHYLLNVEKLTLEYNPVIPAMSSSGVYSGGEPFRIQLGSARFEELESALFRAVSYKLYHSENRVMGSGMIRIKYADSSDVYILTPEAPVRLEIERLLGEHIPR